MKNRFKIIVMLVFIIVIGCNVALASSTNVTLTINSSVPLNGDILKVTLDGKYFCAFSESILKSNNTVYRVNTRTDISQSPYDIKIEYIKNKEVVKTFNFIGHKRYDVELNYFFDGETIIEN